MNVSTSTIGNKRKRRNVGNVADQENTAILQLGPEFTDIQIDHDGVEHPLVALNLSEARILIREALKERKKVIDATVGVTDALNENEDDIEMISKVALAPNASEVLKNTLGYLDIFARFKDQETCAVVENLLASRGYDDNEVPLHPFERAQLGSLTCDEPDEAKTLIPSLAGKRTDEELYELLNQLRSYESIGEL